MIFLKRKKQYLFLELLVLFFIFVQYIAGIAGEKREGQAVVFSKEDKNNKTEEQEAKETLLVQSKEEREDKAQISTREGITDSTGIVGTEITKKEEKENKTEEVRAEDEKAQKIRVLLTTTGYKKRFHDSVKIVPAKDCILSVSDDRKKTKTLKAGKTYIFRASSSWFRKGTIDITPEKNGKIKVCSIRRACGNPSYRGRLELRKTDQGILLVNELFLEEYLYAVVPSEMPVSYGIEALKVQAACARCYAYSQLGSSEMKEYNADVDDSTSYQVYNNVAETADSIKAVELTKDMVPATEDGKMITAYYYSTSCGYTANFQDAWERAEDAGLQQTMDNETMKITGDETGNDESTGNEKEEKEYLQGKPQFIKQKEAEKILDLSSEENFRDFLLKETRQTFDSAFPWYRWKVSISKKAMSATVKQQLLKRFMANPSMIEIGVNENLKTEEQEELLALLENLKAGQEAAEAVLKELDFGTWESLEPVSRSSTGMITCMKFAYSRMVLLVYGEYNIRCLLAPGDAKLFRQDGSSVAGLTLLPSSFFFAREKGNTYIFQGGGYGHGVGMSQNGVKTMAEKGYSWKEILQHYYEGITVKDITKL